MRNYKDCLKKCLICTNFYKIENYYYEIAGCNKEKKKICAHITLKYANYNETHIVNFSYCVLRYQANIKARKQKKTKEKKEEKMQAKNINNEVKEKKNLACSQI